MIDSPPPIREEGHLQINAGPVTSAVVFGHLTVTFSKRLPFIPNYQARGRIQCRHFWYLEKKKKSGISGQGLCCLCDGYKAHCREENQ